MLLSRDPHANEGPRVVVIGGSAGGSQILHALIGSLPRKFGHPVLAVLHRHPSTDDSLAEYLGRGAELFVQEPCDKQVIVAGCVYLAPANYHMLVERGGIIELSVDDKVNWSRPSIDVLFESAARAFGKSVIGILLSGANADGAFGMRAIHEMGGTTIAQDPAEAQFGRMPQAAIDTGCIDRILKRSAISEFLIEAAEERP